MADEPLVNIDNGFERKEDLAASCKLGGTVPCLKVTPFSGDRLTSSGHYLNCPSELITV